MPVSDELNLESDISGMDPEALEQADTLGVPAPFSCPDCGGVLSEFYDGVLLRFRCQVGHSYSPQSVMEGQAVALDHSLWNTYKSLDERVNMMERLALDAQSRGDLVAARRFQAQGRLVEAQKMQLYQILQAETDPPPGHSAADEAE